MINISSFANRIICLSTLLLLMLGCGSGISDQRLLDIDRLASTHPDSAVNALKQIDPSALSGADRHFYDLLRVKTADKAYIVHTSDSLILDVIDYYASHPKDSLYAEALYYGGRVYSDIGDYPTALTFFQKSLDRLPPETDYRHLRSTVNSQTGRLLSDLRMYNQALPYIDEALKLNRELNDSINIMYELNLKGDLQIKLKQYDKAEQNINTAIKIASKISPREIPYQKTLLASIKQEQEELDSALILIKEALAKTDLNSDYHDYILANAVYIYHDADILDTARIYAQQLVDSKSDYNFAGYAVLLSPALRKRLSSDSIYEYITNFAQAIENYHNDNDAQATIVQNSSYNYRCQQQARERAEKKASNIRMWLAVAVIAVLILTCIILLNRHLNTKNQLKLRKRIDDLEKLKTQLEKKLTHANESSFQQKTEPDKPEDLLSKLRNKIQNLIEIGDNMEEPAPLQSPTCSIIRHGLETDRAKAITKEEWEYLELEIAKAYPDFLDNLRLLAGGKLKPETLHISILIKCGFSPNETIALMGKSKGSIFYWRKILGFHIFNEKPDINKLDKIVRLLQASLIFIKLCKQG